MIHIYKIKHKFIKEKKDGTREIENFGFLPYKADSDSEIIYALSICLSDTSNIAKNSIKLIEHFYNNCEESQKQDFSDYEFKKEGEKYVLVLEDKEYKKQFFNCQLCFSLNGKFKNTLFINGTDAREYYACDILKEEIKDIIDFLTNFGVIYRSKMKDWKIQKV
jgi:hypothetical protein